MITASSLSPTKRFEPDMSFLTDKQQISLGMIHAGRLEQEDITENQVDIQEI
jgi:hypothetical protein